MIALYGIKRNGSVILCIHDKLGGNKRSASNRRIMENILEIVLEWLQELSGEF